MFNEVIWKDGGLNILCHQGSRSSGDIPISAAENRIERNIKATAAKMWDKRMEQEDNKYETLNTAVQNLFLGHGVHEGKRRGSAASTAAASSGSGWSWRSGQTGLLPTRMELNGWEIRDNVRGTAIDANEISDPNQN